MKNNFRIIIVLIMGLFLSNTVFGREFLGQKAKRDNDKVKAAEKCMQPTGSMDLTLNNVRARINTGGDMWWDLAGNAQYEIPKGSRKTAMFSAALWIGGIDVAGSIKLAAQRYRSQGVDFWPGPLTIDGSAVVDRETCDKYDKIFKITKTDVIRLKNWQDDPNSDPNYPNEVPDAIKYYPANGDPSKGQSQYLAPFFDKSGDGVYDYEDGDYPFYDFDNVLCPRNPDNIGKPIEPSDEEVYYNNPSIIHGGYKVDQALKGDQTLWWVFNDAGNKHQESEGQQIGLEIRAQAFAFATNDEINNMTFYSYEIVNRSTYTLTNTFFSQWVDTDIGYGFDDYVGCDVPRGLGYCYNGKAQDGNGEVYAYEGNPPAIGVDFFQGPYMDPNNEDDVFDKDNPPSSFTDPAWCGINGVNFGDGIIDNERFGMRRFLYHNNTSGVLGDPQNYTEYYNLLRGFWRDGSRMVYGGTGYKGSAGSDPFIDSADFMFPGLTDVYNWGTYGKVPINKEWTEEKPGSGNANQPYDRRFLHSAGPFTLEPGAVNYITVGIPFAQAPGGGPMASVELLRKVDDKCQALFDNCFKVIDGPDAPELIVQELDQEIILYLKNDRISNNYKESYEEKDPTIPEEYGDQQYRFEGYKIFQLKNKDVSIADISDESKARLVAQCDIKNFDKNGNTIGQLINYYASSSLNGALVPVEEVNGTNEGIRHSFRILEDQFAQGDKRLVNHKKYYFIAIAYAYNGYKLFNINDVNSLDGQKRPYLAGRKTARGEEIRSITVIPHNPAPMENGMVLNSAYGSTPKITRVEGFGNGGYELELTQNSVNEIMNLPATGSAFVEEPVYESGKSPINIKVVDPLNVKAGQYQLRFIPNGSIDTCHWQLIRFDNNGNVLEADTSDLNISFDNEQLFPDYGISVSIKQVTDIATDLTVEIGKISGNVVNKSVVLNSTLTFADSTKPWLSGIPDNDASPLLNWIKAGSLSIGSDVNLKDSTEDYYYVTRDDQNRDVKIFLDENEQFEKIISGTWAPYRFASIFGDYGPAYAESGSLPVRLDYLRANNLNNLHSVDVVFTNDKSKWTRCPVIEMVPGSNSEFSVGKAKRFELRKSLSVNKEGQPEDAVLPNGTVAPTGMGWFPGYAINVETGERLNMMFGEDSYLAGQNGADMKWNPTSDFIVGTTPVWAGKHYIYVFGHNNNVRGSENPSQVYPFPAYDEGETAYNILKDFKDATAYDNEDAKMLFANIMWVGLPLITTESYAEQVKNGILPCDAKIRIRVAKPYKRYSTNSQNAPSSGFNQHYPVYEFSTDAFASQRNQISVAKEALNMIGVVPNPYYAFSKYETTQLDNRVRIINLPQKCTVTIYTINGVLVRQYKVDKSGISGPGTGEALTSIDWDLKNFANIPISGGAYIIHVKADGIGEKVVKWFGALRPTDLNSF